MIYTTLKANREAGIDIIRWYEETICDLAYLFKDEYEAQGKDYYDIPPYQVDADFTEKEIRQRVWKDIKNEAKTGMLVKIGKMFIEVDTLVDIICLCKKGILKRSDLHEIKKQVNKREDDHLLSDFCGHHEQYYSINDVIDAFYPCSVDMGEECNNCCNCD